MSIDVGKNILYVSSYHLILPVFGYVFWFVTARLVGSESIGIATYMNSLSIIIGIIVLLDISWGMKRPLGLSIAKGDLDLYGRILTSALIVASLPVSFSILLLAYPNLHLLEFLKIEDQFSVLFLSVVAITPFLTLFTEALIAALKSRLLIMPLLLGSLMRFPILLVGIYVFNAPIVAVVLGFFSPLFVITIFYGFYCFRLIFGSHGRIFSTTYFFSHAKEIVTSGLSSWVPHLLYILGLELGVVTLVSTIGESAGGQYYIVLTIILLALFIVSGINRVTHASIASMQADRQRGFVAYTMKLAFMITVPISMPLLFFAKDFILLLGEDFTPASGALSIMIAGLPMSIITEIIYYYFYGLGNKKEVLLLGLAGNVPRIFLYVVLSPVYGVDGAALAYTMGTFSQLIVSVLLSRKFRIILQYRKYAIISLVPALFGFLLWLGNFNFIIASIIVVIVSAYLYAKLNIFTERELRDIVFMILPDEKARLYYPKLERVLHKIK